MNVLAGKLSEIQERAEKADEALMNDNSSIARVLFRVSQSQNDIEFLLSLVREQQAEIDKLRSAGAGE